LADPAPAADGEKLWIALDDVTLDGGCLQFIEGSHHWGLQKPPTHFVGEDMDEALRTLELPPGTEIKKVPIVVPAGHGTFHHRVPRSGRHLPRQRHE
jgi:ectoine hydroxylase-related dioxygenase (phytanoyl-CoA dioxygenase family)